MNRRRRAFRRPARKRTPVFDSGNFDEDDFIAVLIGSSLSLAILLALL